MSAPHDETGTRDPAGFRPPMPAEAGPVPAPIDPPPMRIGREERERAQERLRDALADDVLTIVEFDDRLGAVLRARTQEELDALLADLPRRRPVQEPVRPTQGSSRLRRWIVAIMSGHEQRGRWRPDKPVNVIAIMGGAVVDLRDADTDDGEFVVDAYALMGRVDVIVPDDAEVDLGGFAFMGGRDNKVPVPRSPNGPLVRVNGYALMSGVVVRGAGKKDRQRYPVSPDRPERVWQRSADPRPVRPRILPKILGGLLAAGLILGPGRAAVTADEFVMFGGGEHVVTQAEIDDGEDVDVFVLFGGVDVVVPDGITAAEDVTAIFGGAGCDVPCSGDEEPDIVVDGFVGFGGAEILTETEHEREEREDAAD